MAANRKLQGEIDRTLKKVQEGVEIFDEIWEKVYGAQNQNQKEKFEAELKSQIKKLQRYRDDIKTWITNSDIKDKRPLTDARKLIETEMERFKVCEKEFKTKAFSKEGLSQAPKEDPKEKEKNRVRKWIASALETITGQVDVYEAELEQINNAKKKKKDSGAQKWEDLIERCRYHEERLEMVLRLIDNESLSPEDVDNIKDQLDYLLEQMVEGNTDEVDGIDDDQIYEELGLDELGGDDGGGKGDDAAGTATPSPDVKTEAKTPDAKEAKKSKKEQEKEEKEAKEKEKEKKREKEKVTTTELPSINAAAKKAPPPKPTEPPKPSVAAVPAAKPAPAPVLPAATAVRGKAAAQVPLTAPAATRGARAAQADQAGLMARAGLPAAPAVTAAAAAPRKEIESASALGTTPALGVPKPQATTSGGLPPPSSVTRSASLPAESSSAAPSHPPAGLPPPAPRAAVGALPSGLGALDSTTGSSHAEEAVAAAALSTGLPAAPSVLASSSEELGSSRPPATEEHEPASMHSLVPGGGQASASRGPAPELPDEAISVDEPEMFDELASLVAEATSSTSMDDQMHTLHMLNMSLQNMPEPSDSERPKTYTPRNPYPTPNSFPQTPAAVFDAPAIFDKFDTDTLFFIFYYQQGTYQQYLAARELKKQSWRYHKKYLTWFQRHEEPKVTAEEFEQGTYVYFDYETGWCQRIKSEFTFEYGYLEDELQV